MTVHYSELFGLRKDKYAALNDADVESTQWQSVEARAPFYLFVPRDYELEAEYNRGWQITDAMPVHSVGLVTARDALAIQWTAEDMWEAVQAFCGLSEEEARQTFALGPDARDWKVSLAQEDLRSSGAAFEKVVPVLYRPFDVRFTYYTGVTRGFICRPRPEVASHMIGCANLGLCIGRAGQVMGTAGWNVAWCTRYMSDFNLYRRGGNTLFPLYLGAEPHAATCNTEPCTGSSSGRVHNIDRGVLGQVHGTLGLQFDAVRVPDSDSTFGAEHVLHYIYAVLHSPTYRERYAEFLKIDFPRIPLTSDVGLFRTLCEKGRELVALHLLESPKVNDFITDYPVPGDNVVAKGHPRYVAPGEKAPGAKEPLNEGRVYIGKDNPKEAKKGQYFDGVPPEVWEFHIGGYQVCEKWLKDRRGRILSYEDIHHYQKIVVALKETIRLMAEIDAAIPKWPIE